MTTPLVAHLEKYLGVIEGGSGGGSPIKVVRFRGQPEPNVVTYVTLGLSRQALPMPNGRKVRQELLLSAHERHDPANIASLLMTFGEYIAAQDRALLRGDVVGPSSPLMAGVQMNALYAAMPVFFPGEFATFHGTSPPTVFVWMIPLHGSEAEFVKRSGWDAFEDNLESADIDFWGLHRPPLQLSAG
ncbi:MAG: suppressor of fused domain protein [Myxococcales bacterium]|nr:suppressor of fused domain protein [Myxococcales bacterium]